MVRPRTVALGFQELKVGDEWVSPARTITESDVVAFAGISGDYNPLHVDHESARKGPFRRPVAHGLLGLSILSGLASHSPLVETLAFLGIVNWTFQQPIFFGDTVHVVTRVEELEPRARGRRGVVTWRRLLVNQKGETVQEGLTQTLVRSTRPGEAAQAPPTDLDAQS